MARNGSGTYVVYTPGNPVVTGTTISSTAFNNTINDIATALTGSISADGQTPITANIPMNSHKLTGLAAPTVAGDALSYGGVVAGSTGAFTSSALGTQVIATNGGTTTLTSTSPYYTVFTGTFVQTLVLPDATTLTVGQQYGIDNDGSLAITVKTNGGATLWTIASGCDLYLTLTAQATAVGTWETDYQGAQLATGKTLVVNNSVTVNGTDGTTMTFPTTSATIARTDAAQTFTGLQTFGAVTTGGANTFGGANTTIKASYQLLLENAAGSDTYGIYNSGAGAATSIGFRYGGVDRVTFASTGIVTMAAYGAGAATFSAAGVISSVSDETWKTKDGVPLNPDEMLQKLEPGYWFYNEEKAPIFGAERQLGFYAQNVNQAIGPEAAPIPEKGKPWGYYDRSVLAITVLSLQKALATIESLTSRIEVLEQK